MIKDPTMNQYYRLGTHSRPITTSSAAAQRWFDRGLIWCYGYNFEEAEKCFNKALEQDPGCAMAYWGVAFANGPFINKTWEQYGPAELPGSVKRAFEASQAALAGSDRCTPAEKALIKALCHRYPGDQVVSQAEFDGWDDAFASAMRQVYRQFPDDLDVISLFASALMQRTPWQLWDTQRGVPASGADTLEIIEVLEHGLKLMADNDDPPHPGINHMYIHTLEMSPHPEKALRAADDLRDLIPDLAHLCHMPSHIDVLCGHYYDAVVASEKAVAADALYLAQVGPYGWYPAACCHNLKMMMNASMLLGQLKPAMRAADIMADLIKPDLLSGDKPFLAYALEGYYSGRIHVLVRFGRWQEIIDEPAPADPELFPVTTAMDHYAKGVAYAATGEIDHALDQQTLFKEACARISETRYFSNNFALDILGVAEAMLAGELAYRQQDYTVAFDLLREAVRRDEALNYSEPWPWTHPPRHALGALLLEQGHVDEAAAVYRADLGLDDTLQRCSQHPDNVWSLHGYVECLERQQKSGEAKMMQARLDKALARADVEINASCACRLQHHCCD
jgi:tetratricopeptide (TPR) repeat protein